MLTKALLIFASLFSLANAAPSVLSPRDGAATSLSLATSQWIWTGEENGPAGYAPASTRVFRKTIPAALVKSAVCATILITADDTCTLYVNGQQQANQAYLGSAQVYTVALQPHSNLIAVSATNFGGPAGLIATVTISYSDGSSQTFVTDSTWKTFVGNPPTEFQYASTDDSSWPAAVSQGPGATAPWGSMAIPPALDITQSHWIWTSEASTPGGAAVAPGTRAFRKTITSPAGKNAVCAKAVITTDNSYTLYLNGNAIGSGDDWTQAQYFSMVTSVNASSNLFAVAATNVGAVVNPAGVLATILIAYDDGTTQTYVTDTTWKTVPGSVPSGFQLPSTDDSTWSAAVDEGVYGTGVWGQISVPAA